MIVIKNVEKKDKIQKLQKQRLFQNSLLESFSHELRTPLNCGIQSIQALLLQETRSFQKILLNSALGSNYLLLHQINDILDSAALETENFSYTWSYFSFNEILHSLTQIYQESFNVKRINFKVKCNTGSQSNIHTQIRSDKNRLTQILVNLLNNSLKFTPEGGTIELTYTLEDLNKNSKARYARIQVKDTGIGIDPIGLCKINNYIQIATIPSLKQIETQGEFIGLGLCFCGKLAQGLSNIKKDNFEVRSQLKQGTTVSFYVDDQSKNRKKSLHYKQLIGQELSPSNISIQNLEEKDSIQEPIDLYQQFKDNQQEIKIPEISLCFDKLSTQKDGFNPQFEQNIKKEESQFTINTFQLCEICAQILIVDDIPFNHLALKAMLSQYQIKSESAYDGYQALQTVQNRLKSHCPSFIIILMDIEMPIMNGFETTKKIQAVLNENKLQSSIVMCSAYDTIENIDAAKECGMDGFLFKPVNMVDLKKILNQNGFSRLE